MGVSLYQQRQKIMTEVLSLVRAQILHLRTMGLHGVHSAEAFDSDRKCQEQELHLEKLIDEVLLIVLKGAKEWQ